MTERQIAAAAFLYDHPDVQFTPPSHRLGAGQFHWKGTWIPANSNRVIEWACLLGWRG